MTILNNILNNVQYSEIIGEKNIDCKSIVFDSRQVSEDSIFVATKGTQVDGHEFIDKAIEKGAKVIVCEEMPPGLQGNITYVKVENSQSALGIIASNFYNNPSEKLTLIGITGTNGKTTIATLLYNLFNSLGYVCGLLSTVENYVAEKRIEATHTTPDPVQLNVLLNDMVEDNCQYCFMEVSSHAIDQKRIGGLSFKGGVFTNITHDHLDYHKTFKAYIDAKKAFFDALPKKAFALVNKDDRNSSIMLQNTKADKRSFAIKSMADYTCRILEHHFDGMLLQLDKTEIWTGFIGDFNASNLLAVFSVASLLGIENSEILTKLSELKPVRGRLETINNNCGITAIVDYAHTPDALKNVLETINKIRNGDQQIITVVGAGGNRDKEKRPVMAKTALYFSDKLILTSDNPRNEDPEEILKDMEAGINNNKSKVITIIDRDQAIKTACMFANKGDIVIVAGKGHETYQEINGVKHHFDDKEVLIKYLK